MKISFAEARKSFELRKDELDSLAGKLPKKIGLLASVQYISIIAYLKSELEKKGKKVYLSKGNLTQYNSQVLGCDVFAALNVKKKVDSFLFIGSGKFHAIQIALQTRKNVFIWQPGAELNEISKEEIKVFENKRKGALIKFLHANEVGILVSVKPGQYNLKKAVFLRKKLKKKSFIFLFDTLNLGELENFSCHSWINTACPNIVLDDSRVINSEEIAKL